MLDLNTQDSIVRMLNTMRTRRGRAVSEATISTFYHYIRRFCDFCGKTPDELIEDRKNDYNSKDMFIRRRHEEKLKEFASYLIEQGLSSNTIYTAIGAVRSLYKSNYFPMIEVIVPSGHPVRVYKIPTKEELKQVIDLAYMPWHGAFMMLTKDCGMSLQDMLNLKVIDGSPVYGSIYDQIKKGQVPIHLHITREKTNFRYHTFLGEDSFEMLNNDAIFPDMATSKDPKKRLFPYHKSTIQCTMRFLKKDLGWKGTFSPYSLRKWFNTQLTLDEMNDALIEIMMGHSLGRTRSAYLVPPPQKLIEIYEKHYPALKL